MPSTTVYYRLLSVFLLIGGLSFSAKADHLVGGELSYTFVGYANNDTLNGALRYQIFINMYRDCVDGANSAFFDGAPPRGLTPMHVTVYRGTQLFIRTLELTLNDFREVDKNLGNPCLETDAPICQEIGRYIFFVELPQSNEDYTIAYSRCCRNPLSNIVGATEIGSTYFITITAEAQRRRNSSPVFNIDPPIIRCLQEEFLMDLSATDQDGDSLVYKFCDPVLGGGQDGLGGPPLTPNDFTDDLAPLIEAAPPYPTVTWRTNYSRGFQLGTASQLFIDPATGEVQGLPAFQGTFVMGVCVEEWSRDSLPILLSETKREMQITVVPCNNIVDADLLESEIDAEGRFFIRGCGLGPQTIINESTERSAIVSTDWELDLPGGTATGTSFNWTTPSVDEPGVYPGRMILNRRVFAKNCRDTADFLLGVYPTSYPDFEFEETGCDDDPITFSDLSTTDADRIDRYVWNFADGTAVDSSNRRNIGHRFGIPGLFPIELTIVDNNNCEWTMTKNLNHFPSPRSIILEPGPGFGCKPYFRGFVNRSTPIDDTYLFYWEFGDGTTSEERDPSHTYEENGLYDVYLSIESPEGCFVDTTFQRLIDVRAAPEAGFDFVPDPPTSLRPEFLTLDRSEGSQVQRYIVRDRFGDTLHISPTDGFNWQLRDTGTVYVTQIVTHPSGCIDSLTRDVRIQFENTFHLPTAFTPNGDGLNDIFLPVGIFDGLNDYELRIWNRWGEIIFKTTDLLTGWDGRFKGTDSPGGGYLWDAQFRDERGNISRLKGGVTLVR